MVKVGHWKNKQLKIIKGGGEVINVACEISREIGSWEIKSYFFQLILFIAGNLECLQTELVKLLALVTKALAQKWFLGFKIIPVVADLFFLISCRLSFEVLNASRENEEREVSVSVCYRLNVFSIFCLMTIFTESLYWECLQCGGVCRLKHDHSLKQFFPVSVGKEQESFPKASDPASVKSLFIDASMRS